MIEARPTVELRLRTKVSEEEVAEKVGKVLTADDYNLTPTRDCVIRKPDGQVLCIYRRGIIPPELRESSWPILHEMKDAFTTNRGLASGTKRILGASNRSYAMGVPSAILGAFDAMGPKQFCRLTAWTGRETAKFKILHPLLRFIGERMAVDAPERWEAQMAEVRKTHPDWLIPETPFSTVTVNNCVDSATECLTRRLGWASYRELRADDEILAYDPESNTTRWEHLLDTFVNENYRGEMVSLTSRGFEAFTTPDHRWPMDGRAPGSRTHMVATSEAFPGSYWSLLRAAPHEAPGDPTLPDALVRLVAWYMTEGSLTPDGRRVILTQSARENPENVAAIRADLEALGARPRPAPGVRGGGTKRPVGLWVREEPRDDGCVKFVLVGDEVPRLTSCAPGPEKVPTMEFLCGLTSMQAQLFVDTCIAGDGSVTQRRFYQHHKARMDAFVTAAVLAGLSPALDRYGTHCSLRGRPRIYARSVKRRTLAFAGTVWCPRVPSSHWVARRAGKVFLTGNTYPTGVHKDQGDLDEGISTLAVLRRGSFVGGVLVFPEYRVGVDMQDGDLLLMDAHSWHGNTDFDPSVLRAATGRLVEDPGFERISIVSYFRSAMTKCGTSEVEAERQRVYAEQRSGALLGE